MVRAIIVLPSGPLDNLKTENVTFMNKHTKLAFLSSLLAGLSSLCAHAAVYPNTFTDAGAIPQSGTAFSVEHLLGGMGSSITSIDFILTFNSSASLSGDSGRIQGLLTLGTGTSSPYVSFYPTATSSSGSQRIYDMTFSGSSGSPGTGFTGLDPNSTWSLALWDTSTGGIENGLAGWSLNVTAVPEPVNVALGVFAVVALLVQGGRAWRHRRQANGRIAPLP